MANRVLWRAQADSGARRVDQKGRGYVSEETVHAVDSSVTSGERGMGWNILFWLVFGKNGQFWRELGAVESSSWLGRTAGWSERTWVCVRRNNARSWLVGYLWRAVILKFWVWVIRDHSWDHSWILPLEISEEVEKTHRWFSLPYWLKLRLWSQCNWRPIGVSCCPLPSDQGFTNIRDHSYSEFPCCFFDWVFF